MDVTSVLIVRARSLLFSSSIRFLSSFGIDICCISTADRFAGSTASDARMF